MTKKESSRVNSRTKRLSRGAARKRPIKRPAKKLAKIIPFPGATTNPCRWFMDYDEDGNNYIVPANCRAEWQKWIKTEEQGSRALPVPSFAIPIDFFFWMEFSDPCYAGVPLAPSKGGAA